MPHKVLPSFRFHNDDPDYDPGIAYDWDGPRELRFEDDDWDYDRDLDDECLDDENSEAAGAANEDYLRYKPILEFDAKVREEFVAMRGSATLARFLDEEEMTEAEMLVSIYQRRLDVMLRSASKPNALKLRRAREGAGYAKKTDLEICAIRGIPVPAWLRNDPPQPALTLDRFFRD